MAVGFRTSENRNETDTDLEGSSSQYMQTIYYNMQPYTTSSTDVNKHHIRVQILKLALPKTFPTVVRRQYQFSFHQVVKLEPTKTETEMEWQPNTASIQFPTEPEI